MTTPIATQIDEHCTQCSSVFFGDEARRLTLWYSDTGGLILLIVTSSDHEHNVLTIRRTLPDRTLVAEGNSARALPYLIAAHTLASAEDANANLISGLNVASEFLRTGSEPLQTGNERLQAA